VLAGFYIRGYFDSNRHAIRFFSGANKINSILEIIDKQYVDTVNMNQLIEKTAYNLINELDPHSVLIPAEDLQMVNEPIEGSFSGIGISFNLISDTILVITVFPGGPAEKAGILPYDRIITINDTLYAGKKNPDNQIQKTIRGLKNTKVKLGIQRGITDELMYFDVTRGDVPNYSIDVSYVVSDGIGYIKVRNFARTTYNEFLNAIAKLKSEGCTSFIIDLRDNSGGVMDVAIRMINEFMPARKPIVYAEGKAFSRQNFRADGTGSCQDSPLVVLMNELSGSASEIFAGAIQDNDRGLIIGRRSYGKGLVQAPIPLKDGSELRLTVARYYTPSGRCIQKTYQMGNASDYEQDLYNRYMHGEFFYEDSIKMIDSLAYQTLGGRTVYGGGGIMPDIFIPRDTNENKRVTSYYVQVENSGVLFQYTLEYSDKNRAKLSAFATYEELFAYLQKQPILDEFVVYAESKGIKRRPTFIEISKDLIVNFIHAIVVRNFFSSEGFYPVYQKDDVVIKRGVQVLKNGDWKPQAIVLDPILDEVGDGYGTGRGVLKFRDYQTLNRGQL
jgi:carboxyl-terminal processing protease